jgi:hypothetical protein
MPIVNTEALAAYYLQDHAESLPLLERAQEYAKQIHKLDMNMEIARLEELKRAEGTKSAVDAASELFNDIKVYRDDIGYVIKHSREGEYYMTKEGQIEALSKLAQWFESNQKEALAKSCYEVILSKAVMHQLPLDTATKHKISRYFPDRVNELRKR